MSSPSSTNRPDGPVPEHRRPAVSLAVLAGVAVAFAVLFFQVVRPFALPLFLAAVFAVLAMPLHERVTAWCGGRGWLSALLITCALLLLLLGPTTASFLASYRRAADAITRLEQTVRGANLDDAVLDRLAWLTQSDPQELRARGVEALRQGEQLLFLRAIQTVGNAGSFVLGACVFLIAGFFFLKDGRSIVREWEGLTPLDVEHDREIRREFAIVCRAVVISTILAAMAQAVAFGLGLSVINLAFGLGLGSWLVLLSLLLFVAATIPLVGSPVVWLPLAGWLVYQQHYLAALVLVLYGAIVVGNIDNLVRMVVLGGSAGLHPLLALVSVLGGIDRMGVLGAFIGPVVAGVFVSLLRILKVQLDRFENRRRAPPRDETFATIAAHTDSAS